MKYSGIDLHSNNSLVTVMDEEDRVVRAGTQSRRIRLGLSQEPGGCEPVRDQHP